MRQAWIITVVTLGLALLCGGVPHGSGGADTHARAGGTPALQSSEEYKAQAARDVDAMAKEAQVMVDMVFSFGELGFQEIETSKYLTGVLEKEGFRVERGISGIPTAWMATWGERASR